jgi:hypothetical protein
MVFNYGMVCGGIINVQNKTIYQGGVGGVLDPPIKNLYIVALELYYHIVNVIWMGDTIV